MQPVANSTLSVSYMTKVDNTINMITPAIAIVTLYNTGSYLGVSLGSSGSVDAGAFANVWGQIATRYKAYSNVWFELMNAPSLGINTCNETSVWFGYVQAAVYQIQSVGAANKILIPSALGSTAEKWQYPCQNGDVMNSVSYSNIAFAMTQYLSADGTATGACTKATPDILVNATTWLRTNSRTAFITSIGSYFVNRLPPNGTGMSDGTRTTIIVVVLVVVGALIFGAIAVMIFLKSRGQGALGSSGKTDEDGSFKPIKKRLNVDRKSMMEERELRDAVKQMMMSNNVPLKEKPEVKALGANRMRLDAASATETFQAKNVNLKDTDSSQFSHFVNFTSSRFQVESQAPNNDDNYLF
eukprot:jgi/Hompol1/190/HPOL_005260-RA